jgi:hypothetical protein
MKRVQEAWPVVAIAERTTVPLLKPEKPWESMALNAFTVLRGAEGWRMWYASYDATYRNDNDALLCYATSDDGIRWTRPDLGLVEYEGSKNNNILFDARNGGGLHGQCVFLDTDAPASERYRMVFVRQPLGRGGWFVHGAVSGNGLRWSFLTEPLLKKNSDTQQACFRDGGLCRLYVRMWSGKEGSFTGKRQVGYTESATFGAFPDPAVVLEPDAQDPNDLHFYNSAATKLRDDLHIMFPSAYHTSDHMVRPHLAMSNDGRAFERIGRGPAVPFGAEGGFDGRMIYVQPGAIPGDKPNTWWFYYVGYSMGHDDRMSYSGGYGRFLLEIMLPHLAPPGPGKDSFPIRDRRST